LFFTEFKPTFRSIASPRRKIQSKAKTAIRAAPKKTIRIQWKFTRKLARKKLHNSFSRSRYWTDCLASVFQYILLELGIR